MLNQCILVGRLVHDPEIEILNDGRKKTTLKLAIQRGFKDAESGEYETDILETTLWSGIAESTVEYCKKGSTVGIKARLAEKQIQLYNGDMFKYPEIIAEKITFINTKKS